MELNGALLNRDVQENLGRSADLAGHLGQLPNAEPRKRPALARRSGLVRSAVFQVLACLRTPLARARSKPPFAGEPLSWNTVKDCLHKNARRPDSPIEQSRWAVR